MPAVNQGADAVASSPHSRRCEATTESGGLCKAWARRGEETCWLHGMSKAEQLAAARRGGLKTAALKRAAKAGKPRSGLKPHIKLEEVLATCTQGLQATFADAGLPQEIDHATRLLSVAVLLQIFPRQYRATPEEAAAILLKVLPERVSPAESEAEMQRLVTAGYEKAREAWRKEAGGVAALRGLYTETAYPRGLIAEWEDAKELNAELAAWLKEQEAFWADKDAVGLVVV